MLSSLIFEKGRANKFTPGAKLEACMVDVHHKEIHLIFFPDNDSKPAFVSKILKTSLVIWCPSKFLNGDPDNNCKTF